MSGPLILIVLDGWGYRRETEGNAIALGNTPTWDALVAGGPMTLLEASGRAVGLPEGQMGNSEVGHLNLGAGRIVPQDIVRISEAIDSGRFNEIPELIELCDRVKRRDGTLHLLGLVGPGGVHAVHHHLEGALDLAEQHKLKRVVVHAFLDGRDTPPRSAAGYMRDVQRTMAKHSGLSCTIGTVVGRYFAMDRDRRWDRTKLAYDAMVHGVGKASNDFVASIEEAYARDETDEFLRPLVARNGEPPPRIRNGDGVFCLNFRPDRMRQIVQALGLDDFDDFDRGDRPHVDLVTMTQYNETFPFPNAFPPTTLARFVGQIVSESEKTQLRTAETEKYAHVTYFFNCGIEAPFAGEDRELVPSPRVATYDLKPEMSAHGITDVLCRAIKGGDYDFTLCNYANGDMVGHTGVLSAAIKAVETVDACLKRVLAEAERVGATVLITADHGNCEVMIDPETGGPHTAHTTNLVPFLVVGPHGECNLRSGGRLCDVGPTILNMLEIDIPVEMTGHDLRKGFEI